MSPESVLAHLPDIPRWVLTRALVRDTPVPLYGAAADAFAVVGDRLASVVGRPDPDDVRRAAAEADEVLSVPENVAHVRAALPGWRAERVRLHTLGGPPAPGPPHPVRLLEAGEVEALAVPKSLGDELRTVAARETPIAAAFDGGAPVAFVYPTATTGAWWDVSVDTLATHRRRGFAHAAAVWTIGHLEGRAPVWCAVASNRASAALARAVGFRPVDAIWLLTRPAG